ncbi:hypothetical protein CBS101457_000308 [Exobasidium rhododendri]|nr:hypothetical protein CBS101457_000308 [Exobasidium rhododendri]
MMLLHAAGALLGLYSLIPSIVAIPVRPAWEKAEYPPLPGSSPVHAPARSASHVSHPQAGSQDYMNFVNWNEVGSDSDAEVTSKLFTPPVSQHSSLHQQATHGYHGYGEAPIHYHYQGNPIHEIHEGQGFTHVGPPQHADYHMEAPINTWTMDSRLDEFPFLTSQSMGSPARQPSHSSLDSYVPGFGDQDEQAQADYDDQFFENFQFDELHSLLNEGGNEQSAQTTTSQSEAGVASTSSNHGNVSATQQEKTKRKYERRPPQSRTPRQRKRKAPVVEKDQWQRTLQDKEVEQVFVIMQGRLVGVNRTTARLHINDVMSLAKARKLLGKNLLVARQVKEEIDRQLREEPDGPLQDVPYMQRIALVASIAQKWDLPKHVVRRRLARNASKKDWRGLACGDAETVEAILQRMKQTKAVGGGSKVWDSALIARLNRFFKFKQGSKNIYYYLKGKAVSSLLKDLHSEDPDVFASAARRLYESSRRKTRLSPSPSGREGDHIW